MSKSPALYFSLRFPNVFAIGQESTQVGGPMGQPIAEKFVQKMKEKEYKSPMLSTQINR